MKKDNDLSKWHFKSANEIKVHTLTEAGCAAINPHFVALRVGFATSQKELDKFHRSGNSPHQIQVSMSPEFARALAKQLVIYADGLDSTVPPKENMN